MALMLVFYLAGLGGHVCISARCWREERGESSAAVVGVENDYCHRFKIFGIKLY